MAASMPTAITTTTRVLEEAGVEFESLPHAHTETALAEAGTLGVPPSAVAKTILLKTPTRHVRAVVPARERLDLGKVRAFLGLGKADVRLLSEEELARDYPEFELGAVPPFGGAYRDRVLVDHRLLAHDRIVLEAGSHEASLRLASRDLVRVSGAEVLDLCQEG